jgi:hypothetical protein
LDELLVFSSEVGVMNALSFSRSFSALAITLMTALAVAAPAIAHAGGHGGGSRGGGFGFHGGSHGGFSGIHGAYGYRGGYGGRYGRWYGGYGYGGWGWPGYGLYLSTLPYGYSTYWWDAMPYYYADSNYYVWDGSVGEYEAVNPPTEVVNQASTQQTGTELFAYPKNGQSAEQQAQDKQQCRTWADAQTGYDTTQTPTSAAENMNGAASLTHRQESLRAQAACLQGRGYSVN